MVAARFMKADLQMQTPVDRFHWRGPEKLGPASTPEERASVAEAYIERCYAERLEVIAITEHNICPEDTPSLIPELEAAIDKLSAVHGYAITLFPGFEVAVTVGAGIHVLCLFEPGTTPAVMSHKLTMLGLPPAQRFKDKGAAPVSLSAELTFEKLNRIIQEDDDVPGILILAHAQSGSGAMDSKTIGQEWSAELIRDPRVLCLELSAPRTHYLEQEQQSLIKSVLLNADSRYRRAHPIATICSSDCKRLEMDAAEPYNHIGHRYTWIKMSQPSVEGLRQAFLDHESRIRFGEHSPEDSYSYPQIEELAIKGAAFLTDQSLHFSPNLNVLIGGSGTGKSTMIDYLRHTLAQDGNIRGDDVRQNYRKSLRTIGPGTSISVTASLAGDHLTISSTGQRRNAVESDNAALAGQDVATVLPVRFFGQREIYNIADDRAATVGLIDDLHRDELGSIARQAAEIVRQYELASVASRALAPAQRQLTQVKAEAARVTAQLEQVQKVAAPFAALAQAEARATFLVRLRTSALPNPPIAETAAATSQDIAAVADPSDSRLAAIKTRTRELAQDFANRVTATEADYQAAIDALLNGDAAREVTAEFHQAKQEAETLRMQLAANGVDVDAFDQYRARLAELQAEEQAINQTIDSAARAEQDRVRLQDELHELWNKELDLRRRSAERLNGAVPHTETGEPFVEVTVDAFGDDRAFDQQISKFRGDRRMISDDDWSAITQAILRGTPSGTSPHLQTLAWLDQLEAATWPDGFPREDSRLRERFCECFSPEARQQLAITRVPDRVDIVLRRQDGSIAGNIEQGLSVGQKCTAVLAILLALDTAPVVIDQPEDEIDNEFTYRELVPLLRRIKERRQVIVVTHDPNVPVNGDAELIYALEAVDGRGRPKVVGDLTASGSLDQRHVRLAVEDIMEGSEEAFRRRFAKYGF